MKPLLDLIRVALDAAQDALYEAEDHEEALEGSGVYDDLDEALSLLEDALRATGDLS